MTILVTGSAGFVGMHTVTRLLADGETVVGFDNRNDYYDPALKAARVAQNAGHPNYTEIEGDLADRQAVESLFAEHKPERVIHLAAQAGVRYSLENPHAYGNSNLTGFVNLLECCRHHAVEHLVFASSSSVYGANRRMPFSEADNVDHPISLYAATKKANELLAHSYAHLYRIPTTGLRFFTVYGPWGRPDMAYFSFTRKILAGEPIELYNHGKMQRDFTYIDDVVEGVVRLVDHPATPNPDWSGEAPDPATSNAPWRIYNIGNDRPVALGDFVATLEKVLGTEAEKHYADIQPGDVEATWADITALEKAVGYRPTTTIDVGLQKFADWYRAYHGT